MSLLFNPLRGSGQRWFYSFETFVDNLGFCLHRVRRGLRNLARWADVIWFDEDWDDSYLTRLLRRKLSHMEASTHRWQTQGAERHRREMAVCRNLLARMEEDRYESIEQAFNRERLPHCHAVHDGKRVRTCWWRLRLAQQSADEELFGKVFSRHFRMWWD